MATRRPQPRWRSPLQRTRRQFAAATLIPILLVLTVFTFIPIVGTFWLSFVDYSPARNHNPFAGLANYRALLADPVFWTSLRVTVQFVLMVVPLNLLLTLPLAVGIESVRGRLKGVLRTFYFLPSVTSMAAVALIWSFLYHPARGPLNYLLSRIGVQGHSWLGDNNTALAAIVIMYVWQDLGYNLVIFMAGLSGIPQTFYDAARVDGANAWQLFWRITLPLLRSTLFFVVIMTMISAFKVFVPMKVMTDGGPFDQTRVLVLYIYQNAFGYLKMGYGSALSVVLFAVVLAITVLQAKYLRKRWEY